MGAGLLFLYSVVKKGLSLGRSSEGGAAQASGAVLSGGGWERAYATNCKDLCCAGATIKHERESYL